MKTLQAVTRLLVGVALGSQEALDSAVSLPQFRMLAALDDLGESRSARVAESLGVKPSTVTRVGDQLVAAGHVTRGREPGNRSVVTLALTATGRRIVRQVAARREQELKRILGKLAPPEREQVTAALRRLVEAADEGSGAIIQGPVPP